MAGMASGVYTPALIVADSWREALEGEAQADFERLLPAYLLARRWFGGKARHIQATHIRDVIQLSASGIDPSALVLIDVEYAEGTAETYMVPLACADAERAALLQNTAPQAILAHIQTPDGRYEVLYEALSDPRFCAALLDVIADGRRLAGNEGELVASTTPAWQRLRGTEPLLARLLHAEQSNTSIVFGDRLILKLFRHLEAGINPDLEVGRFLTEHASFANIPPVGGSLEYQMGNGVSMSVAILQGFVANQGDAWQYTLTALHSFYERVAGLPPPALDTTSDTVMLEYADHEFSTLEFALLGDYADAVQLLGRRTSELHLALAGASNNLDFQPEPFSRVYQRSMYEALLELQTRVFASLRTRLDALPQAAQPDAHWLLDHVDRVAAAAQPLLEHQVIALRLRHHGDYHLGQVLYTGADFFIIDFEGEPARSLQERRMKRSPLQDVAGMLRSFHYASYAALFGQGVHAASSEDEFARREPWAKAWYRSTSALFLKTYLQTVAGANFIPADRQDLSMLLDVYLLEKAIYELGYELNNRPDWVKIPLQGIRQLLPGV